MTPPRRLTITIHRIPARDHMIYGPDDGYENCIASGLVDPDIDKFVDGGYECYLLPGSYIEYGLPFQLLISHFRFGFGQCGRSTFRDWKFEAFDGEEWRDPLKAPGVGGSFGGERGHRHAAFTVPPPAPTSCQIRAYMHSRTRTNASNTNKKQTSCIFSSIFAAVM